MRLGDGTVVVGSLEPYCCLEVLQICLFGQVRLGVGLHTGSVVAIKCIEAARIQNVYETEDLPETPLSEVFFARTLVKVSKFIRVIEVFKVESLHLIVFDYANGEDLIELLKQYPTGVPEHIAAIAIRQAAEAIADCHKNRIALQDFSLENCLLVTDHTGSSQVFVCDPGQACLFEVDGGVERLSPFRGSIGKQFRPPEIFDEAPYLATKIDSWCLGWTTWYFLFGMVIFETARESDEKFLMFTANDTVGLLRASGVKENAVSATALDFIFRLMAIDPARRMSVAEALDHAFLKNTRGKELSILDFPMPNLDATPAVTAMKVAMNFLASQPEHARYKAFVLISRNFKALSSAIASHVPLPVHQAQSRCNSIMWRRRKECPIIPDLYTKNLMPLLCAPSKPSCSLLHAMRGNYKPHDTASVPNILRAVAGETRILQTAALSATQSYPFTYLGGYAEPYVGGHAEPYVGGHAEAYVRYNGVGHASKGRVNVQTTDECDTLTSRSLYSRGSLRTHNQTARAGAACVGTQLNQTAAGHAVRPTSQVSDHMQADHMQADHMQADHMQAKAGQERGQCRFLQASLEVGEGDKLLMAALKHNSRSVASSTSFASSTQASSVPISAAAGSQRKLGPHTLFGRLNSSLASDTAPTTALAARGRIEPRGALAYPRQPANQDVGAADPLQWTPRICDVVSSSPTRSFAHWRPALVRENFAGPSALPDAPIEDAQRRSYHTRSLAHAGSRASGSSLKHDGSYARECANLHQRSFCQSKESQAKESQANERQAKESQANERQAKESQANERQANERQAPTAASAAVGYTSDCVLGNATVRCTAAPRVSGRYAATLQDGALSVARTALGGTLGMPPTSSFRKFSGATPAETLHPADAKSTHYTSASYTQHEGTSRTTQTRPAYALHIQHGVAWRQPAPSADPPRHSSKNSSLIARPWPDLPVLQF